MTDGEWTTLITAAAVPAPPIKALTFLRSWASFSRPAAVTCDDGNTYIAKGLAGIERALTSEQVVGRLAQLVNAPVPPVAFVDIADLKVAEPQMTHFADKWAHGSREVAVPCGDRMHHQHAFIAENRPRFASLCVLYSWCGCFGDHQFIYENTSPHLVHSVDHGHFFPKGPNWTVASLQGGPAAVQDANFDLVGLTQPELREPRRLLSQILPERIADAVAAIPTNWGVDLPERIVLAEYILRRKLQLDAMWAALI